MEENQKPKVIKRIDSLEINLIDFLQYLYTHRIFLMICFCALPAFVGLWSFFIKQPVYRSHSVITVTLESNSSVNVGSLARFSYWAEQQEMLNKLNLTEQYFHSLGFRKALLEEFEGRTNYCPSSECKAQKKIINRYLNSQLIDQTDETKADIYYGYLDIFTDNEKYTMTLSSSTPEPLVSLALANVAAHTLVGMNFQERIKQVVGVKKFLKKQTEKTRIQLNLLEEQLSKLQKKHKIISSEEVQSVVNKHYLNQKTTLGELNKELASSNLLVVELNKYKTDLKNSLASGESISHIYMNQVQQRLELLKYQKLINKAQRRPASELKKTETELSQFKEILKSKAKSSVSIDPWSQIQKIEEFVYELQKKKAEIQSKIQAGIKQFQKDEKYLTLLPDIFREMADVKRNIHLTTELYSLLQTRLQETQIQQAGRTNDLSITAPPERPTAPAGMGMKKKFVVSAVGGVAIGISILLLLYILIPTIRDPDEVEEQGLNYIGGISWFRDNSVKLLGSNQEPPLVLDKAPSSFDANSIRQARFRLERHMELQRNMGEYFGKILMVSSVNSAEGKSFMSANLAHAFSVAEFHILLLDLDFGRKSAHKYFKNLQRRPELEIINEDYRVHFDRYLVNNFLHVIQPEKADINACDYLETEHFHVFLQSLREEYDLIIIDTPPTRAHLEPYIISQHADAILMLANQRSTLKADFLKAYKLLQESSSAKFFALLNFIYEDFNLLRITSRYALEGTQKEDLSAEKDQHSQSA